MKINTNKTASLEVYGMKRPNPNSIYVRKGDRPPCESCKRLQSPLREKNQIIGFYCSYCDAIKTGGTASAKNCLRCEKEFLSQGPQNRRCDACNVIVSSYSPDVAVGRY